MITTDFIAASVFLICETFIVILKFNGKMRHPSKKLERLIITADVLAIVCLAYILTMRAIPYIYLAIKEGL